MKLELEISDELWKRIQHRASLFHLPEEKFLLRLLEQHVPLLPDPEGAQAHIDAIRATVGPEDDYDIDEFLRALEENRGRRVESAATERSGEAR